MAANQKRKTIREFNLNVVQDESKNISVKVNSVFPSRIMVPMGFIILIIYLLLSHGVSVKTLFHLLTYLP